MTIPVQVAETTEEIRPVARCSIAFKNNDLGVAVQGVMGEPVSAAFGGRFPVFTEICRDFSISGAKYGAPI